MDQALERLYTDAGDSGSYGGIERLYRRAKEAKVPNVSRRAVKEFLSRQQAYTLHRPARRHFPRNHIYAGKIDQQWQADLADMVGLQRDNDRYRYILTVIDVFSKFAWAVAVRNKDATTVTEAFDSVMEQAAPRKPERLQTDKGKEFFNKDFGALMKRNKINHFATESDQKAAVVERFNRTLKSRLWTFMSAKSTSRWITVLPEIMRSYNGSFHRSIGMAPKNVTVKDQDRVWARLYGDGDTETKRSRILDGSRVRINRVKGIFEKGYMPNWVCVLDG